MAQVLIMKGQKLTTFVLLSGFPKAPEAPDS